MTERTKWHLNIEHGRQVWEYDAHSESPQSIMEKYLLGEDISNEVPTFPRPTKPIEAAKNGVSFYEKLQSDVDGHWPNDYGGPMFLLPGLVITSYITDYDLGNERKLEIIEYLKNTQREDGGWGLHIESPSTMFGSALTYVSLRILGVPAESQMLVNARKWISDNGKDFII
jgi:lanosterol synthase